MKTAILVDEGFYRYRAASLWAEIPRYTHRYRILRRVSRVIEFASK